MSTSTVSMKIQPVTTSEITFTMEVVTPELAEEWLLTSVGNRSIRRPFVEYLANQICDGEFRYDGNPIRFNLDGQLFDGHHRLLAIVRAKIPVELGVVRGIDRDAIFTADTGVRRSNSDILHFDGVPKYLAKIISGSIRWFFAYDLEAKFLNGWKRIYSKDIVEFVGDHPEIEEQARFISTLDNPPVIPRGSALFLYSKFAERDEEMAAEFFEKLYNGNDLRPGNPVHTLRRILLKSLYAKYTTIPQYLKIFLAISAWNFLRAGKTVKTDSTLLRSVEKDFMVIK